MTVSPIFCGHCGAQNPTTEHFCFSCGYTLSALPTAAFTLSVSTGLLPAHTLLRQRYRVLQTVGQGGMGAVYLAQDISLGDRSVAVKEMSQNNTQQAQEAIENFKREAHLLASLQHANLPSIYDHFEESGRWYLVMSYIQGETLEDYLSRVQDRKLPLEEVLHIGQELCSVLSYLHTHQPPIIFRDLKPGNVMRNTDGHIYLIDFGIARHFKPGQAKDTANYGSAGYAPPEQYGKAQTTERSDIYSLGVTLYEMVSGYDPSQSPFRFPSLQSLVPTMPDQLVMLITQMLDMDESKRPANIKVVQQELQQLMLSAQPAARQYKPISSMPQAKQPRPAPQRSRRSGQSSMTPLSPGQVHRQSSAAKTQQNAIQPASKKRTRPIINPKVASILWMLIGAAFFLNGVSGPFRFNLETAGGIFDLITIFGFSALLGLLTILLARTKESLFPVTKAHRVEYIAVWLIGGIAFCFGATIAIIGAITATPANSNSGGTYLGIWLIIQGGITVGVTYVRIKRQP